MINVDELLNGSRYKDVEVVTITPTSMSARVDGKLVEVSLDDKPELNYDVQSVSRSTEELKTLRIAQADLRSVRSSELNPEQTEAWLVVANPNFEPVEARNLSPAQYLSATAALIPNRARYTAGLTDAEIMAFPNVCSIITRAVGDGGQSSSRNGATVKYLQIHHSTMTSNDAYIRMVQNGSREVSSSFGIQDDDIVRIVNLLRRPWTSGSATYDSTAFTVETANSTLAPSYLVSEKSKNSLARLAKAMLADGALAAMTSVYIYLHKQMKSRFNVSYGTECPINITVENIISRVGSQGGSVTGTGDTDMVVMRITDWNGRCYLVNDLGHMYIPNTTEAAGLLKAARQSSPVNIEFKEFLPAVARINSNLEGSVFAKLIKSLKAPQARMASMRTEAGPIRPEWVDEDLWAEALARGLQSELE